MNPELIKQILVMLRSGENAASSLAHIYYITGDVFKKNIWHEERKRMLEIINEVESYIGKMPEDDA